MRIAWHLLVLYLDAQGGNAAGRIFARMLAGAKVTDEARAAASKLLSEVG